MEIAGNDYIYILRDVIYQNLIPYLDVNTLGSLFLTCKTNYYLILDYVKSLETENILIDLSNDTKGLVTQFHDDFTMLSLNITKQNILHGNQTIQYYHSTKYSDDNWYEYKVKFFAGIPHGKFHIKQNYAALPLINLNNLHFILKIKNSEICNTCRVISVNGNFRNGDLHGIVYVKVGNTILQKNRYIDGELQPNKFLEFNINTKNCKETMKRFGKILVYTYVKECKIKAVKSINIYNQLHGTSYKYRVDGTEKISKRYHNGKLVGMYTKKDKYGNILEKIDADTAPFDIKKILGYRLQPEKIDLNTSHSDLYQTTNCYNIFNYMNTAFCESIIDQVTIKNL